ncbi:hypothetical protein P175DRAFT_0533379 [Aspergillus ochraceoroseus IBT 24754]|uniref:Uncharacterized protein n=1 Tax=Aspergillus ochraceoroseus IBT 24754 TaxID=1392256 RepID=A0A2T5LVR6_9EURO|nr:uncharacterized protein P175DRAFT_0533379 [Aspergillus ochraceoroseus IBT 24754]PTU20376.1 hypothetical protein P175DRAFT_0533379 [Aspergillus ochraceoroseus IBT 24754]
MFRSAEKGISVLQLLPSDLHEARPNLYSTMSQTLITGKGYPTLSLSRGSIFEFEIVGRLESLNTEREDTLQEINRELIQWRRDMLFPLPCGDSVPTLSVVPREEDA